MSQAVAEAPPLPLEPAPVPHAVPEATPAATQPSTVTAHDWAIAVGLACLLASVYLLTFSGAFHSIDELSFFASTENWVLNGSLAPRLIAFNPYHNPIGPFEPGYALLASGLYAAALSTPAVSQAHAVVLLNPALTAVTVGALFLLARQLGYSRLASTAAAGLYGLGTMAWPYTKSFLREPAVGLLWVLAFCGVAACARRPRWWVAALAALLVVLGIGIKVTSGVALPVVVGALTWSLFRARKLHPVGLFFIWLGGAAVAGAAVLLLLQVRNIPLTYLTERLTTNGFTGNGLQVWYGLLFSPGKSVFVYSPALVLGVLGYPFFFARHRLLAVSLALLTGGFLLSVWATGWDAGLSWGPRYALPLMALWVLPALALLSRRWALPLTVPVAAASVAYQALVATSNWAKVYQTLHARYPGFNPDLTVGLDWARWRESPAVEILKQWGRPSFDMIWLYSGLAQEIKLDRDLGYALAGVAGFCALAWLIAWRWRRAAPAVGLSLVAVAVAASHLVTRGYANLADYPDLTGHSARRLAEYLSDHPLAPAALVNVSSDIGTYPWLGLVKGPLTRTWISPLALDEFETLLPAAPGDRLVVVMDRPHITRHSRPDALLTWLNTHAYRLGSEWLDGYELVYYAAGLPAASGQPASVVWPTGVALTELAVPATAAPGTALPLSMTFTLLQRDWSEYDRLFTNLVGPNGKVLVGQETWLGQGNPGSTRLRAGDVALDQRGLWIPPGTPPGVYTLVVGFTREGAFVPAELPDGSSANYAVLAQVTITGDS